MKKNLPLRFDVTGYIEVKTKWVISSIFAALMLRFYETTTKFEKNLPLGFDRREFFPNFVAFSEYIIFTSG